jgi:hypothetical protein
MSDPGDLLKRANELSERANGEQNPEVRDRLFRMAAHYTHLAESEQRLAANPVSIASIRNLFRS